MAKSKSTTPQKSGGNKKSTPSSKKTSSSPVPPQPEFNWKRFLILFAIFLLILGLMKTIEFFSPALEKTEGTLDMRSQGYFSEPPEIEVFELLEKLGSDGRFSHLIIQFIDAFMFVPIYCMVYSYLWLLLGEGSWKPLMIILVGLNALVDTAENLSVITLLLCYPFFSGVMNVKTLAESTEPIMSLLSKKISSGDWQSIGQVIVKGLARSLHSLTPTKFMLVGLFFTVLMVMTILSHLTHQAKEEEEEEAKQAKEEAEAANKELPPIKIRLAKGSTRFEEVIDEDSSKKND
ncbi:predicted protein [Naegleria gruberi]|uniref:Predicted protein n=1 Tax=Naegleria gruberi TaxID=5762 RepID=D2V3T8_NAEGR|nr:uncharacterized protein NAEGRDRAFT_46467 [Naegleria gruberi]EFC48252.1 predicted protein [Naegleria gruberi]|eukprot:XP_002680996.1 predicted protein [Naegleria gruberi strain NEG-M]